MGVKQRHTVRHTNSATCRAGGGQQQSVDAAARKQTGVQVHLYISPAAELHLTHTDHYRGAGETQTTNRSSETPEEVRSNKLTAVVTYHNTTKKIVIELMLL